ncbi:MAG: hypothetical protein ACOYI5_06230 [Christensenellales bacterium]
MWQRIKFAFSRFMQGRYGADQLSRVALYVGIAFLLLSWLTPLKIFSYLGLAIYFWVLFRMFSKNAERRSAENRWFLNATSGMRKSASQARNRAKNSKQYKYFRCVKCRSWLKLPRGVGKVTVTCGKCKHQFRKKA